ncbi:hypothetical protein PIB30_026380 [Stylosanthes scabra]|uniref:FAF domain-containing protein n=1 Tax=Stylosanthes scabra TaxID=79078 RepID=A0ABU6QB85_9FABA|nr:hypothetical protein [Stylosanthes scabra]
MIFSLYLPVLLSLSLPLSFFLHAFKKHLCSLFFCVFNAFKNSFKIAANNNYRHALVPSSSSSSSRRSCTETLGFESIDENLKIVRDFDDENHNHRRELLRSNSKKASASAAAEPFPPPLPSLNQKGQASFALVPVRENGRLQLNKVRIKRPEILYASREHGRLKMFLVPDQCHDDLEAEEEKQKEEDETTTVKSESESEIIEEQEEEEESVNNVGDWKFMKNKKIEGFMRCHQQLVNQRRNNNPHNHHYHHNLNMYGVISIA